MRRPARKRPWDLAAAYSAKHYGLITREYLLSIGVSSSAICRKLKSGELRAVYRTVYRVAAAPRTWSQSILAPCLRKPGNVWVFGRTAGAFWELDGCDRAVIEVATVSCLRNIDDVLIHRVAAMPSRDVAFVSNIPVTTVHRTLIDLGGLVDPESVEMALECALRRRITSIDRLSRLIQDTGTRGRRGAAVLSELLRKHEERPTESALETKFAQFVRRHDLPTPTRQVKIRDEAGLLARVDFIWESERVIVEVDSRSHHMRRRQWEADLRRRNGLTSRGYWVLHVTYERLVRDPQGIADEIKSALGGVK
jgi:very-short-patch-repair endonuclease